MEAVASGAYRLFPGEDAASGVRRAIVGRLDKAVERLREAGDEGEALPAAIHGARKDLKKARAALRLVREGLGEKAFERENRALRDAARLLSASRDAEVKVATLDSLIADGGAPPGATALWRDALAADRGRIVGGESAATAEAPAAIEAVAGRAAAWKIRTGGWRLLAPGIDAAYREGRESFAALGDAPDFGAIHELRKRGKDLSYQVRLLRATWPAVLDATAEEIHDLTDRLGDHHDLAVLALDLAGRAEVDPADRETLRVLIEDRQVGLLADAVATAERVYAEEPKAFVRRLRAYWRAWRHPT
jgi:CHAD domain-containing protein